MENCLFCKIVSGAIPVTRIAEDEHALAFPDINPQAPTHFLVVPKRHIASIAEADDWNLIGKVYALAARTAREKKIITSGFRMVTNSGPDAGQTVFHLHVHVLGGRPMAWPPG